MSQQLCAIFLVIISLANDAKCTNKEKNMCETYEDYYRSSISKRCVYSSDIFASVTQLIKKYVGHYEKYTVTTADGYILSIFRIPPKVKPKGVVWLQHTLLTDAEIWLSQGSESLALNFSKSGYDVWLPCNRGTPYSMGHVNITKSSKSYWDFSFHEIGIYDYVAFVDFMRQKIGPDQKIIFVGYSMSTTASLIYASMHPEHAEKNVAVFFELSPVATIKYVPFAVLSPLCKPLARSAMINGIYSVGTQSYTRGFQEFMIGLENKKLLLWLVGLFTGWTPDEFDVKFINIAVSHTMKPSPVKSMVHYCQIADNGGHFTMFDNKANANRRIYGSSQAPEYPLHKIRAPVYLISSSDDYYGGTRDANILYGKLSDRAKKYGRLNVTGMNHMDFLFAKSRYEKVFNKMWDVIHKIEAETNQIIR